MLELTRIAIVDRGQAALRLIRAIHEYNARHATTMQAVAVVARDETDTPVLPHADDVVRLDVAHLWRAHDGRPAFSGDDLAGALGTAGVDAAWVGWESYATAAITAAACRRIGIDVIGPPLVVRQLVEDRIGIRCLAERAGVPVGAWSGGAVASLEAARHYARAIGYPVALWPTAGRSAAVARIHDEAGLVAGFADAVAAARTATGDPTVFLARATGGTRQIDVDIVGDRRGTVWAVGVRDGSVQRAGRRLVVEAPSPVLSPREDRALRAAAVRVGRAAGYESVGTVAFHFDPSTRQASFFELEPCVPADHAVVEAVSRLDLAALQLHVARGARLDRAPVPAPCRAVGVRLDVVTGACHRPARVTRVRTPSHPGVRFEDVVPEGQAMAGAGERTLMSIVATASTRRQALRALVCALEETMVELEGATTNRAELLALLSQPALRAGACGVDWLDRALPPPRRSRARMSAA